MSPLFGGKESDPADTAAVSTEIDRLVAQGMVERFLGESELRESTAVAFPEIIGFGQVHCARYSLAVTRRHGFP
jgi:hypothetical protein